MTHSLFALLVDVLSIIMIKAEKRDVLKGPLWCIESSIIMIKAEKRDVLKGSLWCIESLKVTLSNFWMIYIFL